MSKGKPTSAQWIPKHGTSPTASLWSAFSSMQLGMWWRANIAGVRLNYVHRNSIFGRVSRLSGYDPKELQYFGWIPISVVQLTVFKSRHNSVVLFGMMAYSFFLINILKRTEDVASNPYYVIVQEMTSTLTTLSAFVLSGFVAKVVAEWRQQRQTYATLIGKARNFTTQIAAYIRAPKDRPDLEVAAWNARRKFGRYIKLSMEFATQKGYNKMDSEECREHLEKIGYLAPGEWALLANGDRHTTVYMWMHWLIRECQDEGIIGEMTAMTLCVSNSDIRAFANDLNNYLFQEIPFPYAHVTTMLVKILMIAVVTKFSMITMWRATDENENVFFQFLELAFVGIITAVYQGLLDLHHILHSPFGEKALDVNHEGILYQGLGKTIDFMLGNPPGVRRADGTGIVPVPNLSVHADDIMGTPRPVPTDSGAVKKSNSDELFQIVNPGTRSSLSRMPSSEPEL